MSATFDELLDQLRGHAEVAERWRAAGMPGRDPVKGINEADARHLAGTLGGRPERSEVWVLPGGWELLAPWRPTDEVAP